MYAIGPIIRSSNLRLVWAQLSLTILFTLEVTKETGWGSWSSSLRILGAPDIEIIVELRSESTESLKLNGILTGP